MKDQIIKKIRGKLDKLDDKILFIIKKRSILVNQILSNKTKKKQIVDRKRIKIILKNIKKNLSGEELTRELLKVFGLQ